MPSLNKEKPILAFLCNWAPYSCYMDLCRSESSFHHMIYPVKVMCTGRVDPAMVLFAFEKGAEGVMVLGCKDKECRYGPGPKQFTKTAKSIKALIHVLGLESDRFSYVQYSFNEMNRLLDEIDFFTKAIYKMKKSPFVR
jgi:coenzyme F420-reducing hydrogenase delta subunit